MTARICGEGLIALFLEADDTLELHSIWADLSVLPRSHTNRAHLNIPQSLFRLPHLLHTTPDLPVGISTVLPLFKLAIGQISNLQRRGVESRIVDFNARKNNC